jgi:hypothetical protein
VEDPLPASLSPILARQNGKANTTAQTLDPAGNAGSENPEAVTNFPAAHVLLAGNFDSAKKSVHVEKITPAAQ